MGRHEKVPAAASRGALAALALGAAVTASVLLVGAAPPAVGAAATTSVVAGADGYVDGAVPSAGYGTLTRLRVDTTPEVRSYLRFDLTGVAGSVTRATLDLTPTSNLSAGLDVRGVAPGGTWTESNLTFDTAPAVGAVVATSGAITSGTVVSLDVTGLVQSGTVELALTARSSTALSLASRESATPPILRVDTVADPSPHNTALPGVTGTVQAGKTVTADPGAWDGFRPMTYGYQWQRCDGSGAACVDQSGATGSSYLLGATDVGSTMRVVVTATNSAGSGVATSGPSAVVAPKPPPVGDRVLMAAGDIACSSLSTGALCQEQATSDLLVAGNPDVVLPLGDTQYECGDLADFQSSYDPTWGRVLARTRPVIGNHEYTTSTLTTSNCYNRPAGAPGYYGYFGDLASPTEPGCTVSCKGYYSYDVGDWHVVALNSTCARVGGCNAGDPQVVWLQNDLAGHADQCTLAYYHHPRWTSGQELNNLPVSGLVQALYDAGVDVVLNGHDHDYERFAPLDPSGAVDPVRGYRQFVVGTGGRNLSSFVTNTTPGSVVRDSSSFGVLKMVLSTHSYSWEFVPVAGSGPFRDAGSQPCHSTPVIDSTAPAAPTDLVGATAGSRVDLDWTAATDAVGVVAHRVYRDATLLATLGDQTGYGDSTAGAGSTHSYAVAAVDAAGNESALSAAVTVSTAADPPVQPLLVEGFETGGLSAWTSPNGLSLQQAVVDSGRWAARSTVTGSGASYAFSTFPTDQNEVWVQERIQVLSQSTNLTLLRLRTRSGSSLVTVQLAANGLLTYDNELTGQTRTSTVPLPPGAWRTLGLRVLLGSPGRIELSLDGAVVLGFDESLAAVGIGRAQFGDTGSSGHIGDQVFDDVYVGTVPWSAPTPSPTPTLSPTPTPSVTVTPYPATSGSDVTAVSRDFTSAELEAVRTVDGAVVTPTGTWGGTTTGTTRNLTGLSCPEVWSCWAVGQKGAVVRTADGGRSWSAQASTSGQDLTHVSFLDTSRGLAVGKKGTIVRTGDGGVTWQARSAGTDTDLLSVTWVDATRAVVVGRSGLVLTSADGGLSWTPRGSGTSVELRSVTAVDSTRVVAVGRGGTVLRSSNAGTSWMVAKVGTRDLSGVSANGASLVAVGAAGATLASADAGLTWSQSTSGTVELTDVSLTAGGRAWASGRTGVVLTSSNAGQSWSAQSSSVSTDLWAVAVTGSARALVVGSAGVLRATVDTGVTWSPQPPAYLEWGFGASSPAFTGVSLALTYNASTTPPSGSTAQLLASVDGSSWTSYPLPDVSPTATSTTVDLTSLVAGDPARLAGLRVRFGVLTTTGSALRTSHDLVRLDVSS